MYIQTLEIIDTLQLSKIQDSFKITSGCATSNKFISIDAYSNNYFELYSSSTPVIENKPTLVFSQEWRFILNICLHICHQHRKTRFFSSSFTEFLHLFISF